MARRQLHPRTDPLQLPRRVQPRRARARAERRHDTPGLPLGAIPAATHISVSRRIRSAAEHRAATVCPAASSVRASARCSSCDGRSRGARGRVWIGAAAHHGRLWGRSAALSASTAHATPIAPQINVLQPSHPPPAAPARRPAAAPAKAAAESVHKPPLLPTTAASWGDPRLIPSLRLTARRTSHRLTCEGQGGYSGAAQSVGSMAAERPGS